MVIHKARANFIRNNKITSCSNVDMNVRTIFAIQNKEGILLDMGVYLARSTNFYAGHFPDRKVYGFDSFKGLPENYTNRLVKGAFALNKLPKVADNIELVVGLFEDTLVPFLEAHPEEIAFVNVDCDLEKPTYFVLKTLFDYGKLTPGVVLRFDEFFNEEDGFLYATEFRAFKRFQRDTGISIDWIGASNNWKVFTGVVK